MHTFPIVVSSLRIAAAGFIAGSLLFAPAVRAASSPPPGFTALFDGKGLDGWWGATTEDPRKYKALSPEEFQTKHEKSLEDIGQHWKVDGDELVNDGHGLYLTTEKDYGDIELLVDYKAMPLGDSGIYLRGVPQVQIWDYTETKKFPLGADKGSGGLWNNSPGAPGKDPLVLADKPFGEWNHFRIIQVGARTTVWLNDKLVVDHALLENFFDKKRTNAAGQLPILPRGPIQLQTHGNEIRWRNVFVRELGSDEANRILASKHSEGFKSVFNGKDFDGWAGPVENYEVNDGAIMCKPHKGGTPYTKEEFENFVARVEFKLPPGGNNGLALRYHGSGDTAYVGMCEVQVLDDTDAKYAKLDPRQYCGSVYGQIAVHRGYLRPVGEWNFYEVTVNGPRITVELNGTVVLDGDVSKVTEFMANKAHPGKDRTSGHFGFAGHNDPVAFRNISIKKL
ncbi:MAG: DUF1080 domain-containing protein [Verrucomicrobia bacterium]|nr:DUF1080 domain-containing protein [Verrucomicrobiota bacterium]